MFSNIILSITISSSTVVKFSGSQLYYFKIHYDFRTHGILGTSFKYLGVCHSTYNKDEYLWSSYQSLHQSGVTVKETMTQDYEVDVPNLVTSLNRTPIFMWYVIRCKTKIKYQKYMCSNEIGLQAQSMITILSSIVNTTGEDLYDYLMNTSIFTLILNKIFI